MTVFAEIIFLTTVILRQSFPRTMSVFSNIYIYSAFTIIADAFQVSFIHILAKIHVGDVSLVDVTTGTNLETFRVVSRVSIQRHNNWYDLIRAIRHCKYKSFVG